MERRLLWMMTVGTALCAMLVLDGCATSPRAVRTERPAAGNSTAAVIGDRVVTLQELDEVASGQLIQVRQQEYDVRRQVLDDLISREVLTREAETQGMVQEQLVFSSVNAMVMEPTEAEIDTHYHQNKSRYGTQTLAQATPRIISSLRSQRMAAAREEYMSSLRSKYDVRVLIEPPRVEVSVDDDASRGPADAPVTIVAFSDYQCPYCGRAESTVAEVMSKYGDKVRFVYRDYPLSFHQNAEIASTGAECAEDQGKLWEMHVAMFANQRRLGANDLVQTAGDLGLDVARFKTCLDSGEYKEEVQNDFLDGQKYGVTGTPTFFINGIMMVGAQGVDAFSKVIDRELARAGD